MPREPEQPEDRALLIAIVVILLADLALPETGRRLTRLLAPLGIPPAAVVSALTLLGEEGTTFHPSPTPGAPAIGAMRRGAVGRRAMYLLAAVRRLGQDGTVDAERRLYGAHQAAEVRREKAAGRVDAAARQHGPLLGWWAVRDDRTTPACFAAHGANFSALHPPAIGWPGTIHAGFCRCKAVAPWPQGDLLEGSPAQVEDRLLTPLER